MTLLNGETIFGKVELQDDYTLRISSESGIQKVPIASLGGEDFQKHGKPDERQDDGKLWSDRKGAVEEAQKEKKSKNSDGGQVYEIELGKIAVFQPLISAYEAANPKSKEKAKSDQGKDATGAEESGGKKDPTRSIANPNLVPMGNAPFSGGLGGEAAGSLISTGQQILRSIPGASSLPISSPSAPTSSEPK